MNLLFIGDVVGRSGRDVVIGRLPELRKQLALDFVVLNGENAAAGFGITDWIDETAKRKTAAAKAPAAPKPPSGPLSQNLTRGDDYHLRQANVAKSILAGRLTAIRLVARRAG